MSESSIIFPATEWDANDYANIITISAAAISSVLLVIFKSRCKTINLCCGAVNCLRDPMDEDDPENKKPKKPVSEANLASVAAKREEAEKEALRKSIAENSPNPTPDAVDEILMDLKEKAVSSLK
jgi:hypothetical protein